MEEIEKIRQERIARGIPKYGPWHPDAFKDRNVIKEITDELIDAINYLEMAQMMGKISMGFFVRQSQELKQIIRRIKNIE